MYFGRFSRSEPLLLFWLNFFSKVIGTSWLIAVVNIRAAKIKYLQHFPNVVMVWPVANDGVQNVISPSFSLF